MLTIQKVSKIQFVIIFILKMQFNLLYIISLNYHAQINFEKKYYKSENE